MRVNQSSTCDANVFPLGFPIFSLLVFYWHALYFIALSHHTHSPASDLVIQLRVDHQIPLFVLHIHNEVAVPSRTFFNCQLDVIGKRVFPSRCNLSKDCTSKYLVPSLPNQSYFFKFPLRMPNKRRFMPQPYGPLAQLNRGHCLHILTYRRHSQAGSLRRYL